MIKTLRAHLCDNAGDENISKMIWVAIIFIVGAFLLLVISKAFQGYVGPWFNNLISSWFTNANGKYNSAMDT